MAKKYIIGSWATGAINETSVLPVVRDDSMTWNVQGVDNSELSVSKNDLPDPATWKEYLKVGRKLVLAVDDSKPWNAHGEAILGGGYIIRQQARVNDTIRIKIAGPDQYLNQRIVTSVYNGTVTDPTVKALNITGNSYQSLMAQVIAHCFTATGSGTRPTPPSIPITYPSRATGSIAYECLNTDMLTYQNVLDELFDASPFGNEWRWQWRWTSSAKTAVSLVLTIGADSSATTSQINSGTTLSVALDGTTFKIAGFEQGDDIDGSATRLISQTKAGDDETADGSDFTIRVNAVNDVLYDTSFNPGVELTPAQLEAQISSRLASLANLTGTTTLEVAEPVEAWLPKLGQILNISGGSNQFTSGYSTSVRLVKISGGVGEVSTKLEITPLMARYPKLPPKSPFTPRNPTGNGGGNGGIGNPIVPRLPPNQPPPGGGGGGPTPPPLPDFNAPIFDDPNGAWFLYTGEQNVGTALVTIQHENYLYHMTNQFSNYVDISNNTTFSDLADLNNKMNNAIVNAAAPGIKENPKRFSRRLFTDDSHQSETTLFSLDIQTQFGWENIIPNFTTYVPFAAMATRTHVMYWVANGYIYAWAYGYKQLNPYPITTTPTLTPFPIMSSFGSKIFKNAITGGTDTSWEEVDLVPKDDDGNLIYPTSQDAIMVEDNEVLLAGYIYIEGLTGAGLLGGQTPGNNYTVKESLQETILGKYSYGIVGLNLNTNTTKHYSAPNWITETQVNINRWSDNVWTPYKTMVWVKTGKGADNRKALILMPLFGAQFETIYEPLNSLTRQIAMAYWTKTQAVTQSAWVEIGTLGVQLQTVGYCITNGMMCIIASPPGSPPVSYRTKNYSGDFIKSNEIVNNLTNVWRPSSPLYNEGSWTWGAVDFRYPMLSSQWGRGGVDQVGGVFTYNNYWLSIGNGFISRGTFRT